MGGFEANNKHIAKFEAKPYPRAQSPNAVTPAFQAFAYSKIVDQLQSENHSICRKAVIAARELLVEPTKHIQCIAAGITPALVQLLAVPDEALQAEVSNSLQLLMSKGVGCQDALQHAALPALLKCINPQHHGPAVRDAAYTALGAAAGFAPLRAALVREQGALAALVHYAQEETAASRSARALDLLHHCTQGRQNQDTLSQLIGVVHAVPKLATMISGQVDNLVRLLATKLLADLASTQADGRKQAVEAGCVPVLLELMAADDQQQACAAAAALTMITLAREGKVAVHEVMAQAASQAEQRHQAQGAGVIAQVLLKQNQSASELLQAAAVQEAFIVSVLQALGNCAEYPPIRQQLQQPGVQAALEQLQQSKELSNILHSAACDALRILGFGNKNV